MISRFSLLLLLLLILFTNCTKKSSELAWETNLYTIGTQSSPRTADLNNDGILDIVMGAAQNEYQHTDQGILAIDGSTGAVLWKQAAEDQVFGSATFLDVTDDGVMDVFIGGRSANFKALDGTNGNILWEFQFDYQEDPMLRYACNNFYNSVVVPDQNGNNYPDLLTVNGGNPKALPHTMENRVPGLLMVFDSKTGEILAADSMPDGMESYMSPVCFTQPGSEEVQIVFGTGGETISGNLYLASLTDLMSHNLSKAKIIASESGHGFIAPPVLADISQDGYYDIVAISHASTISAIDGFTREQLWTTKIHDTESSNSFAVGFFTDDEVPDFLTYVSEGVWPNSTNGINVMLDGKDGRVAYKAAQGCVTFSSPVVYDLNHDSIDEAIISYNQHDCSRDSTDQGHMKISNHLVALNFETGAIQPIDQRENFKNVFATPWIGDLDHDGYLDIVYSQCYSPNSNLLSFLGMNVRRISTHIRMKAPPVWGGYMGSNGDGIFPVNR